MKKDTVTIESVKQAIEREFEDYKAEQIAKSTEEVFCNAFRINAWSSIFDFLQDGGLKVETMFALKPFVAIACLIISLTDILLLPITCVCIHLTPFRLFCQ